MPARRHRPSGRPHHPRRTARARPGGDQALRSAGRSRPGGFPGHRRPTERVQDSARQEARAEVDTSTAAARRICCHLRGALPAPGRSQRVREKQPPRARPGASGSDATLAAGSAGGRAQAEHFRRFGGGARAVRGRGRGWRRGSAPDALAGRKRRTRQAQVSSRAAGLRSAGGLPPAWLGAGRGPAYPLEALGRVVRGDGQRARCSR